MLLRYLATLSEAERLSIPAIGAEHFCDNEVDANACAHLVATGIKRASCGLLKSYQVEGEDLPVAGKLTVVLDWRQWPVCIVRTTDVQIAPFDRVPEEFAYLEGEGDRTYEGWRRAHIQFFEREAERLGDTFNFDSAVVLERFEKVFP
ncbi:ASCH domain-containing protein [Salinicola lusitanus]|uniref:ASCH domain-containing protein n=1 Tax=Salinicola lusitanus TaxID=1949085 RepID=A0ABZ3CSM3_9GAMM